MADKTNILYLEDGKSESISADLYFIGFKNGSFENDQGKTINYCKVKLSKGLGEFEVSCAPDAQLGMIPNEQKYNCGFYVEKSKIRIIRISII